MQAAAGLPPQLAAHQFRGAGSEQQVYLRAAPAASLQMTLVNAASSSPPQHHQQHQQHQHQHHHQHQQHQHQHHQQHQHQQHHHQHQQTPPQLSHQRQFAAQPHSAAAGYEPLAAAILHPNLNQNQNHSHSFSLSLSHNHSQQQMQHAAPRYQQQPQRAPLIAQHQQRFKQQPQPQNQYPQQQQQALRSGSSHVVESQFAAPPQLATANAANSASGAYYDDQILASNGFQQQKQPAQAQSQSARNDGTSMLRVSRHAPRGAGMAPQPAPQQQQLQQLQQQAQAAKTMINNRANNYLPAQHSPAQASQVCYQPQIKQQQQQPIPQHIQQQQQPANFTTASYCNSIDSQAPIRLTLPLFDAPLFGPLPASGGASFISSEFIVKQRLFDTLAKSLNANSQTAVVIHEVQLRLVADEPSSQCNNGDTTQWHANNNHHSSSSSSPSSSSSSSPSSSLSSTAQVTINGTFVECSLNGRPADAKRLLRLGANQLDVRLNCRQPCSLVLEAVERPTLKAFISSCFKTHQLSIQRSVGKLRANFNSPNFCLPQDSLANAKLRNEFIFDEQTQQVVLRVSLRCALSGRRMRTPARGQLCEHLQCFELESFLRANCDLLHWRCPLCSRRLPFSKLELDQHQASIIASLADRRDVDAICVDASGQWKPAPLPSQLSSPQLLPPPPPPSSSANLSVSSHCSPLQQQQHQHQQQQQQQQQQQSHHSPLGSTHPAPLKQHSPPQLQQTTPPVVPMQQSVTANGTFHPAPPLQQQLQHQHQHSHHNSSTVRRPLSAASGPPACAPPAPKRLYATMSAPIDERMAAAGATDQLPLDPLAAIERTVHQHAEQMAFEVRSPLGVAAISPLMSASVLPSGGGGSVASNQTPPVLSPALSLPATPASMSSCTLPPLSQQPAPTPLSPLVSQQCQQTQTQTQSSQQSQLAQHSQQHQLLAPLQPPPEADAMLDDTGLMLELFDN